MIELRVLGKNPDEVEAWLQKLLRFVDGQANCERLGHPYVRPGRKGDYLAYVNVLIDPDPQPPVRERRVKKVV